MISSPYFPLLLPLPTTIPRTTPYDLSFFLLPPPLLPPLTTPPSTHPLYHLSLPSPTTPSHSQTVREVRYQKMVENLSLLFTGYHAAAGKIQRYVLSVFKVKLGSKGSLE